MEVSLLDAVLLAALGLVAGASGGLLGIGGSVVMIPGLILLFGREGQHLYQAAAMIVNFFVMLPAAWQHGRAGAVLRGVTRWLIPSTLLGIVLGVGASELAVFRGAGRGWLQVLFAVFLAYVVVYNLWRLRTRTRLPEMDEAAAARLSRAAIVGGVGLPTGLLGGLLGIGGGLFAVPAQQVLLRIPLRRAIANSAGTLLWSSALGAVVKNLCLGGHGYGLADSLRLAALLAPAAMLASWWSAPRVHRWPVGVIRVVFVVLLVYAGARVFWAGWSQVAG